jgi:VanZ family protein
MGPSDDHYRAYDCAALERPVTRIPHNFEHLTIFLVTGAGFGFGYARRELILCTSAILFCAVLEVSQLLIPGRHARFSDFLVDALSACVGVAGASLLLSTHVQPTP